MTREEALELVAGRLCHFFPQGWQESVDAMIALGFTADEIDVAVSNYYGGNPE